MDFEYNPKRLKELHIIEEWYKKERNFHELIPIIDEIIELFDCIASREKYLPLKAYCYARLGNKEQAEHTLNMMAEFSFFCNTDKIYRAVTLVSFFITNNASNLSQQQINTIINWLHDPETSRQVVELIFDFKDIVGNITPFDISRLQKKNTLFSDNLIECIFIAMQRDNDTIIYYNKDTNDVQQLTEGYLSSLLVEDQHGENRILSSKIIDSCAHDPIINGLHYLVPRLSLSDFLSAFKQNAIKQRALSVFIEDFENRITNEYSDYIESIDDLVFSNTIAQNFFESLEEWHYNNALDTQTTQIILNNTRLQVVKEFLTEANK
jgi:hypothetical protein